MSLKTILNKETDFTGEFLAELAKDGLWRFNDDAPDADTCLADSSGHTGYYCNTHLFTSVIIRFSSEFCLCIILCSIH